MFRVKKPGGKQNNWSSNFDPECRKVLVKELGKLCHLAELLPLKTEVARGARNRDGRMIEFSEHLVIVLPDREVEPEPAAGAEKACACLLYTTDAADAPTPRSLVCAPAVEK